MDTQYIPKLPEKGEHPPEHVVVVCRNHFYCLPLQAPDRGRLTEDEICSQLMHILEEAPNLPPAAPVGKTGILKFSPNAIAYISSGLFTAINRRCWYKIRESLMCNEQNQQNIALITTSLLLLCFDEPLPATFNLRNPRGTKGHSIGQRDETNLCLQMLHGGGSCHNTANRSE